MINYLKSLFNRKETSVEKIIRENQKPREKHLWQLILKTYAAPARDLSGVSLVGLPEDLVKELILGVTTYTWECSLTGDIRTEKMLGSDGDTLQDILQKVKMYGKQVVTDEKGIKYAIDVYLQPQDIASLPVRQ